MLHKEIYLKEIFNVTNYKQFIQYDKQNQKLEVMTLGHHVMNHDQWIP